MADLIQIESDKKNWAKTIDDVLNSTQAHWTSWSADGVVLMNGFVNARPSDKGICLHTRDLVTNDGQILLTDVSGTITNGSWDGATATAFSLASNVGVTAPNVIGVTGSVNASSDLQGMVTIGTSGSKGNWSFNLTGNRIDGVKDKLSGWITLRFLLC